MSFLVVLLLLVGLVWWLSVDYRRRQRRSVEAFERDVRSAPGLSRAALRAGMVGLGSALDPPTAKVAETLESERRREEEDGEGDDPVRIESWRARRGGAERAPASED